MAEVFISYKSQRRPAARHLARVLEMNGYSVWFDWGLVSGSDFGPQIERELRQAKAAVVLWCTMSRDSHWVREEADLAHRRGIIVPTWIERVDPPLGFGRLDTIDLTAWDGGPRSRVLDRLLVEVSKKVGRPPAPDFHRLVEYEQNWFDFGRPSLASWTQETPPPEILQAEAAGGLRPPPNEPSTPPLNRQPENRQPAERQASPSSAAEPRLRRTLAVPRPTARASGAKPPAAVERQAPPGSAKAPAVVRTPTPLSVPLRLPNGQTESLPMIALPGGEFTMGGERHKDERPPHRARVGAFALMTVPMTRRLYGALTNAEPPGRGPLEAPVNAVSWFDALRACNHLSRAAGLEPAYRLQEKEAAVERVEWVDGANGFRLPTEAEFEYAMRSGTTTEYFWGDDPGAASGYAWFDNLETEPQPVGRKNPNPWGFHDLAGNVYEWCWDEYGPYIESSGVTDKTAETLPTDRRLVDISADGVAVRVIRGGSFINSAEHLRSANRGRFWPGDVFVNLGFRCARSPLPSMP